MSFTLRYIISEMRIVVWDESYSLRRELFVDKCGMCMRNECVWAVVWEMWVMVPDEFSLRYIISEMRIVAWDVSHSLRRDLLRNVEYVWEVNVYEKNECVCEMKLAPPAANVRSGLCPCGLCPCEMRSEHVRKAKCVRKRSEPARNTFNVIAKKRPESVCSAHWTRAKSSINIYTYAVQHKYPAPTMRNQWGTGNRLPCAHSSRLVCLMRTNCNTCAFTQRTQLLRSP